jgi:hypothetical protein
VKDAVGAADRLRAEVSATLAAALGDTGSPGCHRRDRPHCPARPGCPAGLAWRPRPEAAGP